MMFTTSTSCTPRPLLIFSVPVCIKSAKIRCIYLTFKYNYVAARMVLGKIFQALTILLEYELQNSVVLTRGSLLLK